MLVKDSHSIQLNAGTVGATIDGVALCSVAVPSNDTWTFYLMWYDATNDLIHIRKNDGVAATRPALPSQTVRGIL